MTDNIPNPAQDFIAKLYNGFSNLIFCKTKSPNEIKPTTIIPKTINKIAKFNNWTTYHKDTNPPLFNHKIKLNKANPHKKVQTIHFQDLFKLLNKYQAGIKAENIPQITIRQLW